MIQKQLEMEYECYEYDDKQHKIVGLCEDSGFYPKKILFTFANFPKNFSKRNNDK